MRVEGDDNVMGVRSALWRGGIERERNWCHGMSWNRVGTW